VQAGFNIYNPIRQPPVDENVQPLPRLYKREAGNFTFSNTAETTQNRKSSLQPTSDKKFKVIMPIKSTKLRTPANASPATVVQ
jgi:hypothetical protein